jgi:hypothetical protein
MERPFHERPASAGVISQGQPGAAGQAVGDALDQPSAEAALLGRRGAIHLGR